MRPGHALTSVILCLPIILTGCALQQTAAPNPESGIKLKGNVHGGQQPVVGAHVYLLAANTTGYGGPGIAPSGANASLSILNATSTGLADSIGAYVTTDANGSFTITGDYNCTPNTQVYLYALGGNPGGGVNSAAGLLAALGNCPASGSFLASRPFIQVNEVTTIAAAYAMAGFATDATHVSSSGTPLAQTGIANAFANATNLADITTGTALTTTPAGNGTVPQTEINTLANILATCINSTVALDGPTNPTTCYTLFNNEKGSGSTGTIPTDTATAAINIAHNPAQTAIFTLQAGITAQFQPSLATAPNDFTIALTLTGGGLNEPFKIAMDASGDAWITDTGSNAVSEFSSSGAPISPSTGFTGGGMNYPTSIAIDLLGNAWVTNNYETSISEISGSGTPISPSTGFTGGGSYSGARSITIDGFGNVWAQNGSSVTKLSSSGTLISPSTGYVTPTPEYGSYTSTDLAIDASNNVWFPSFDPTGAVELSNSWVPISLPAGFSSPSIIQPDNIAIDGHGDVWITDPWIDNITEFSNSGIIISPPSLGYTIGNQADSMAIDGSGNVWLACLLNYGVSELSNSGTLLSPPLGYWAGDAATGIAIDGSGDVWVVNGYSTPVAVTELIGAATPVTTPLAYAVKTNAIATRP